jgi:hypothetical protein
MSDLHLDERFNNSKELIGRHLVTGQKKLTTTFNSIWADLEVMRETHRQRRVAAASAGGDPSAARASEEGTPASPSKLSFFSRSSTSGPPAQPTSLSTSASAQNEGSRPESPSSPRIDFDRVLKRVPTSAEASAAAAAASAKAGAYFSSWASWAQEKKKVWVAPTTSTAGSATSSAVTSPRIAQGGFEPAPGPELHPKEEKKEANLDEKKVETTSNVDTVPLAEQPENAKESVSEEVKKKEEVKPEDPVKSG